MKTGKILIVDDNRSALSALSLLLQFEFDIVVTLNNPNQIHNELRKNDYDVILLDMNFSAGINSGNEGLFWLSEIKKVTPSTEVVMITAYGDVELAVKALKLGAADFILKPWENEKLVATLQSALKLRKSNQEVEQLKKREQTIKDELNTEQRLIIGSSPKILRVLQTVTKVAKTDANVLITGENGTGKELIAREIHRKSARHKELLVTVDMGAIAETLFESELFGHKKGAFTDAKEDRIGKFQLAHKGTLFLDEIGNLPIALQAKLLVALESRTIIPVGGNQPVPIDIRLISATNSRLETMISSGYFREDLLYRLNTISIEVPPLRERIDDIENLAAFFIQRFERKYQKQGLKLSNGAIKKLTSYPWPGNIRELQHTIEKAVIMADSSMLLPEDFVFRNTSNNNTSDAETLEEMERLMIERAIEKHKGNLSAVATQLGITRQTLYNKMKRYEL
ncbi:MAG TPA: sigma-54 dependent transcriptional regulator [Bacteroidales bacterium]|nr:sigma-54 dependent transcriptional regulator [Bacteroidales bacterium]